ncbi:MAG: diacylglycerol kinase [Gorillibacterium sp.]|nr:diacylglycerol kinase [Gorillibacterium sp.]
MRTGPRFFRSLRFAYEGVKYALASQSNMKIHFFVTFVVFISAVFFRLSGTDVLFILLAVTLVIVTELLNTAIEKTVDLAMPEHHPLAKIAKDTAAAAVLVSAVFAVIVGVTVFYRPVERLLLTVQTAHSEITAETIWIYLMLVLITVIVAETRFGRTIFLRPSLLSSIVVSMATLITLSVNKPLPAILSYAMASLFLVILYRRKNRTIPGLILGAVAGAVITLLTYYLNFLSLVPLH